MWRGAAGGEHDGTAGCTTGRRSRQPGPAGAPARSRGPSSTRFLALWPAAPRPVPAVTEFGRASEHRPIGERATEAFRRRRDARSRSPWGLRSRCSASPTAHVLRRSGSQLNQIGWSWAVIENHTGTCRSTTWPHGADWVTEGLAQTAWWKWCRRCRCMTASVAPGGHGSASRRRRDSDPGRETARHGGPGAYYRQATSPVSRSKSLRRRTQVLRALDRSPGADLAAAWSPWKRAAAVMATLATLFDSR